MPTVAYVIVPIALAILAWYAFTRFFSATTVWEYEKGLRYHKGWFTEVVGPGRYWIFRPTTRIVSIDVRPTHTTIVGQEVLSSDGVTLKMSIAVKYQVVDPQAAAHNVANYLQSLYLTVQIALREIVGAGVIDDILKDRRALDSGLMDKCASEAAEIGVRLLSTKVRDIMFPGELKRVFTKEIEARKEGLAALERARGETAALRNLANAAKALENNPTLMQLRMIQALRESSGNTLVVTLGKGEGPIPLHTAAADSADRPAGPVQSG